jgi:hypothetical protein
MTIRAYQRCSPVINQLAMMILISQLTLERFLSASPDIVGGVETQQSSLRTSKISQFMTHLGSEDSLNSAHQCGNAGILGVM